MNTFEMNDQQVAGLAAAICATAEAMGQEMNPGTAAIMAEDLCAYPVQVVKAALKACRFEVKGKLAMADILQRVQIADGRPGKDEAWAIAMTTNDEFETVVLTDEIQLALAAAKPVLDAGDKVGARMAFNSAYERLVGQAREDNKTRQLARVGRLRRQPPHTGNCQSRADAANPSGARSAVPGRFECRAGH